MACADTKRLRCFATVADPVPKVRGDNNTSSLLVSATVLDDENLLEEILLRLPSKPSSLPRASLVCKRWRKTLSDAEFLKRFRRHHHKPPLLGFFVGTTEVKHKFLPILDTKPDCIPAERFALPKTSGPKDHWEFRGCRHGLAILIREWRRQVIVWDPLTGQQHRLPFPPWLRNADMDTSWVWHAAVLCADAKVGHAHGDCISSSFKVILTCGGDTKASACIYESSLDAWGNIISVMTSNTICSIKPNVLSGNVVYWCLSRGEILAFDIERQTLDVIKMPEYTYTMDHRFIQLLRMKDGSGLGLAVMSELSIHLWERKINSKGILGWVLLQEKIQLKGMFPRTMQGHDKYVHLMGYDEETNVIVLSTKIGHFMLEVESMQTRRIIIESNGSHLMSFYPYRNFYTGGTTSVSILHKQ